MKTSSAQLIVVSDTHVGSKLGLSLPEITLDDGNKISSNSLQSEMWRFWDKDLWPYIHKRAKTRKTIVVVNGDVTDGNHHGTTQIWSNDPLEQIQVAAQIFAPIASKYPVYVTRGTAAHVLAAAAADEQFAREIGAQTPKGEGRTVRSSYHLKMDFQGVLFDIAHHGPNPGARMWTFGNTLRGYARTIILDALVTRNRPPDCIVRSHVHKRVHETTHDYSHRCEAITTPAMQWTTEYGHMVASHESIADVGAAIISIDGGKISNIEFRLLSLSQSDTIAL